METKSTSQSKLTKLVKCFKLLRLDVFICLYLFANRIPNVCRNQLIQDKYCINQIKLDPSKCLQLEQLGPEFDTIKNKVYVFQTNFNNYDTMITTPIGIIITLLIGCWIDKYPGHLKYLLAGPALGGFLCEMIDILNVYYFQANIYHILWKSVTTFSGGMNTVLTGSYAYVSRRTHPKHRVARFAVLEMFLSLASLTSTALGGKLLTVDSIFGTDQYRNYYLVFLTSLVFNVAAFIWVLVFLYDADLGYDEEKVDSKSIAIVEDSIKSSDPNVKDHKTKHFLLVLTEVFRISTITSMIKAVFRQRPHKRRTVLLHLTFGMTVAFMGYLSESIIGLQFAQKVYHWSSPYYSYNYALLTIIPALANTIIPVLLAQKNLVFDSTLCIMGSVSMIFSLSIRGGILEPYAYYVSNVLGVFSGLLLIVKRSIVSRIIEKNESGQIFSLLACIEGLVPLFITLLYSFLFQLTIQTAPGTAHLVVAGLMFYPYILSLWLGLNTYKWDPAAIKFREEKIAQKISSPEL